jgi:TonB family protein
VRAAQPEPVPEVDPGVVEEVPDLPEPTVPDFELPREADPVPQVQPEDLDFPEPAAVQASRPEVESPPAEAPVSSAEPEEVSEGAVVQASASEGIEDFYLSRVQMKIGRGWRPTDVGTRGAREVTCVVSFRIGPQGAVIAPTVTQSSGFSVFDRRALAAIEAAAPLPPPPARFGDAGVEIDFRFSYSR